MMPLAGVIDVAAERQRLRKDIDKIEADVVKIDAKLGNADFVQRAPEEVIEENRERRTEAVARADKLRNAIDRLTDA